MARALVLLIYNLLLPAGLLAMLPGAWKKMRQRGGKASDLKQRLGFFSEEQLATLKELRASDGLYWVHAVSVGEVGIAAKLVRELLTQRPGLRFVLTSTTPTGCALAAKLAGESGGRLLVLYSPVDGWTTARRFLDAIAPKLLILVEAEVWPNLVFAATQRGVPVTLVNARLSSRSERRFRALRPLAKPIYEMLTRVCVQEPEDTARFAVTFGIPATKLACTGSIKFDMAGDTEPAAQIEEFHGLLDQLRWKHADPVLLAASTHAGEERELARVFSKLKSTVAALRFIIVPRHVERTPEILEELKRDGFTAIRRSTIEPRTAGTGQPSTDILLVDTTGELRAWQHLATVVVIGKSFLATGGQNPAEAVMARKPVVFGPHMENFEALVRLLVSRKGAVAVRHISELAPELLGLFSDPARAREIALAGRDALRAHEGSTWRTAELLLH